VNFVHFLFVGSQFQDLLPDLNQIIGKPGYTKHPSSTSFLAGASDISSAWLAIRPAVGDFFKASLSFSSHDLLVIFLITSQIPSHLQQPAG
jgi:hypothetical protein